jgi:glycosyltransferase involved in cell wall biosynthesis
MDAYAAVMASNPITILDLRDTYEIGGPGKTIIETFNAIDSRRFRLHLGVFATRHEAGETPFIKAARAAGMPVHVLRGFNQYDPRLIWRIAELIRTLNVDIVHAHEVKSDVLTWLAAKLRPVPIMTTLHGWIGNSPKQRLMIGLDRRVVRAFNRVVVVSRKMSDEAGERGFKPGQLCLLHNAIVLEKYRRTGRTGLLASVLGRPVDGTVLSCIGRLSAEKGQADLIEQRVRALGLEGAVHFPGYVAHPQNVLEETDLSVLPSHTEGLPNAALEAMAMEVPLLATRVGGTPEVVTDGETGMLVEPRSPQALEKGILDFLAHPARWRRMAQLGRCAVERHFNFQVRTRELEAIYAGLVAGRRA